MLHSSIRIEEEMEEHLYIIFAMVTNVLLINHIYGGEDEKASI